MKRYVALNGNKKIYIWYICPRRKGENGCGYKITVEIEKASKEEGIIEPKKTEEAFLESEPTLRKKMENAFKKAYNKLESRVAQRTDELLDVSRQLNQEILERRKFERQSQTSNTMLKLLGKISSRKEYLDAVVKVVCDLSNCQCVGIRVLNGNGDIPYESYTGFSQKFLKSENLLSVIQDQCACIRAITGKREPQDALLMTPANSFRCDNTIKFIFELSEQDKSKFRGVCAEHGFSSVAVIPIGYGNKIIGAIHLADEREGKVPLEVVEFIESLTSLIGEGIYKFNLADKNWQTNKLLRMVLSDTHSLIAYIDTNFDFIHVNQAYAQVDGRTPEFFIGRNYFELYPDEDSKIIFQRVIETGELYSIYKKSFGYTHHSEREAICWNWNIHPVKDDSGKVEGLILCLLSIAGLKGTKEELMEAQKELVEPRRLSDIGTFVATIAHELRNPLGVIRTAVYNIKRKGQQPSLYKHLANIEKKLSESEHIINNLLSYSHIKMPRYEKIKIYNILDECITSAQKKFSKQKVSIDKKIKSIEKSFIDADPFQLMEIFNNILNNAYQSISNKNGKIGIMANPDDKGMIVISFKDNGMGIDKEDLKKIFNPFFTKKIKGTGLGLTICNELVSLHGGKIDIESEKNEGTTITVSLPIKRIVK